MIESMACGTPVIATRLGSMPELVRDGVNGYLVDAPDQAVAAIEAAGRLERSAVRASVERRFDVSRMVQDYIDVYRRVAGRTATRMTAGVDASEPFRLGINYWPARTAMRWWTSFDEAETAGDFERIAAAGFDSVRVFLLWEAFQPEPEHVDPEMLERLVTVANVARTAGLHIMPTLFTGHMSGVDWIPGWALGGAERDARFRVVSGGRVVEGGLRNWYLDDDVVRAQALFARRAAEALAGHDALWAWDLGNENSNCVVPAHRGLARSWLSQMTAAIRAADGLADVTIGIHMEDLEEDRRLGPHEAAEACDFLTMHGYPIYARWARGGHRRGVWCRSWRA